MTMINPRHLTGQSAVRVSKRSAASGSEGGARQPSRDHGPFPQESLPHSKPVDALRTTARRSGHRIAVSYVSPIDFQSESVQFMPNFDPATIRFHFESQSVPAIAVTNARLLRCPGRTVAPYPS